MSMTNAEKSLKTLKICLLGQTTKQPLSNLKQTWALKNLKIQDILKAEA